jgi:hypothetical protein
MPIPPLSPTITFGSATEPARPRAEQHAPTDPHRRWPSRHDRGGTASSPAAGWEARRKIVSTWIRVSSKSNSAAREEPARYRPTSGSAGSSSSNPSRPRPHRKHRGNIHKLLQNQAYLLRRRGPPVVERPQMSSGRAPAIAATRGIGPTFTRGLRARPLPQRPVEGDAVSIDRPIHDVEEQIRNIADSIGFVNTIPVMRVALDILRWLEPDAHASFLMQHRRPRQTRGRRLSPRAGCNRRG